MTVVACSPEVEAAVAADDQPPPPPTARRTYDPSKFTALGVVRVDKLSTGEIREEVFFRLGHPWDDVWRARRAELLEDLRPLVRAEAALRERERAEAQQSAREEAARAKAAADLAKMEQASRRLSSAIAPLHLEIDLSEASAALKEAQETGVKADASYENATAKYEEATRLQRHRAEVAKALGAMLKTAPLEIDCAALEAAIRAAVDAGVEAVDSALVLDGRAHLVTARTEQLPAELTKVKAALADAEARLEVVPSILSLSIRPCDGLVRSLPTMPWLGYYVRHDGGSGSNPSWQHAAQRGYRIANSASPTSPSSATACWLVKPTASEPSWEGYAQLNEQGARSPYGGPCFMVIDHPHSRTSTLSCEVVDCCICFAEPAVACCSDGDHALCRGCFVEYAREWLASGPADIKQQREGCIPCSCYPQAAGGCTASFDNQVVARMLSSQDYGQFDEQRRAEMRRREFDGLNAEMMKMVRQMAERLNQSAPGLSKQLLAQQLRASVPGARMCFRCHHGPIEHFRCVDLTTHRDDGSAFGGNACPKCRWFAADISQWPYWDGNVPDSAIESVNFAPTTGATSAPDDSAIAQRLQEEERRRLQQIERDHAMALEMANGA